MSVLSNFIYIIENISTMNLAEILYSMPITPLSYNE